MSTDIESLGIIFELQWKKKPGGNNRKDVASIGIWDTPDASLDWVTFKSYVCQNLGTLEDIYVAYIDSDGDELPIESECEFQEALKFARQRAIKGREVVLKVDKREEPQNTSQSTESAQKEFLVSKLIPDLERGLKKKTSKASGKSILKAKSGDKIRSAVTHSSTAMLPSTKERKSKAEDDSISNEIGEKLACIMKLETDKRKKTKTEKDDSPPMWFKKYMQKLKNEIVAEVTANVMYNTRQILESAKVNNRTSCCYGGAVPATKTKKKKTSDEESSDGALSSDQRDHKLLKKIEKLHKREKKLDSKLEKLENKTKRRMEKKLQYKSCSEQPSEKKACSGSRKRLSDAPVSRNLMDALPLNDGPKSAKTHIKIGECFTKVWEVMNNGTLPWTDKTELRLVWGTSGLEPKATSLKCPILMPGRKGIIAVTFQAPEFPGTFESYWHFYHMGVRFGRWLGCAVIVDSKDPEKQEVPTVNSVSNNMSVEWHESICDNDNSKEKGMSKTKIDQPVDLRKKYEPDQVADSSVVDSVVEVDNTCGRINEDKTTSVENGKGEATQRNAEYESDSDDENLSVISGTVTLTSDSEEDDNFVVVPMPPCFMCDVPLEQSVSAVPVVVKEQFEKSESGKHDRHMEPEADLLHTISSNTTDVPCTPSMGFGTTEDGQKSKCEVEDSPKSEMGEKSSHGDSLSHERPEYVMSSRKEIYAVDMEGHCMPVEYLWASHNNNHCNYTPVGHSKMHDHSSENASMPGSDPPPNQGKGKETKHGPSGGEKSSFLATAHSYATAGPFGMNFSTPQMDGDGQISGNSAMYSTSSTSVNQNGFNQCESQISSSDTAQASSGNQPQDPFGTAVHILPETLVNGAISVASQAFTTARAVLSNLRPRPAEDFTEWHWNNSAANLSAQSDRSTTESLNILLEMGFTNKILNVFLLQRYNNDIAKVVAELLTFKDNTGFIGSIQVD